MPPGTSQSEQTKPISKEHGAQSQGVEEKEEEKSKENNIPQSDDKQVPTLRDHTHINIEAKNQDVEEHREENSKENDIPKSDDKQVPSAPNLTNEDIGESSNRQSPIGFVRQMYLKMNEEVCSENNNILKKYAYFNVSPEGLPSLFHHFRCVLLYF